MHFITDLNHYPKLSPFLFLLSSSPWAQKGLVLFILAVLVHKRITVKCARTSECDKIWTTFLTLSRHAWRAACEPSPAGFLDITLPTKRLRHHDLTRRLAQHSASQFFARVRSGDGVGLWCPWVRSISISTGFFFIYRLSTRVYPLENCSKSSLYYIAKVLFSHIYVPIRRILASVWAARTSLLRKKVVVFSCVYFHPYLNNTFCEKMYVFP